MEPKKEPSNHLPSNNLEQKIDLGYGVTVSVPNMPAHIFRLLRTAEEHAQHEPTPERFRLRAQAVGLSLQTYEEKVSFDPTGITKAKVRGGFVESLEHRLDLSRREESAFAYVALDIDHFKKLNDEYGHDMGDLALRLLDYMLLEHKYREGERGFNPLLRRTDTVGRLGGEEFGIVLPLIQKKGNGRKPNPVTAKDAYNIAERIRHTIEVRTKDPTWMYEVLMKIGYENDMGHCVVSEPKPTSDLKVSGEELLEIIRRDVNPYRPRKSHGRMPAVHAIPPFTASFGVAFYNPIHKYDNKTITHHVLMKRADQALYISKNNGRNMVTLWESRHGQKHADDNPNFIDTPYQK